MGYSDNKLLEFISDNTSRILEETRKSREVQEEMLHLLQKISADTKENNIIQERLLDFMYEK